MSVFDPVDTSIDFPAAEREVSAFWKDRDVFHQSMKQREGRPTWVFYEGPPTANGKPHPGHVLTRVVKDLFPRYKTMRGFYVPRKAGWDTHGLPVEIEVEKALGLDGKEQIEAYGVEKFIRKCRDSVFKYTADWENLTEKIGFWIDLPDAYVTYHKSYVESVWWSLKQLFEKNLLYQGHKIVPYCPRCGTPLSSAEVGLGYKEVDDPSVFVTFHSVDDPKTSFLAWTTTPWTLPSNAGLAVNVKFEYAYVKVVDEKSGDGETLVMAKELVEKVMGKVPHEIVKTVPGKDLLGQRYTPLFDWVFNLGLSPEEREKYNIGSMPESEGHRQLKNNAWKVIAADFVTLDAGSGIVHTAPAFGADDYEAGQKEGLPVINLVDNAGKFVEGCGDFTGRFVKDADNDLIKHLRNQGLLLKREVYKHDYPFCWRCDSPLLYYARAGWFIRTTQHKDGLLRNNARITWKPEHIRDGRFGKFLESNIDWALSRERYWGTPLPIWMSEDGGHVEAVGSLAELAEKPGVSGLDAFDRAQAADPDLNEHLRVHKPWIDEVTYDAPDGKGRMKRVPEVIDCWYDSGAMPFAQWGYPHVDGSAEKFAQAFPADFISEAIDQTRGWFYTLLAESTLLFDHTAHPHPYKTCVVLGHVGDEFGKKLSKSNPDHRQPKYDPNTILDEEGADALRWFFYAGSPPWTNNRFSRDNVRETQKEFLLKLWNVFSFFTIYANIDGFDPNSGEGPAFEKHLRGGRPVEARHFMDRWVLSEMHQTINTVRHRLDGYDIYGAAASLSAFAESLSNWYVQRNRDRYWRSWKTDDRSAPEDLDKLDAYWTLYECLSLTAKTVAPFVPFLAEKMWRNLAAKPLGDFAPESVHLCDFPTTDPDAVDCELAEQMALVREVVALGRNVRASHKLKVRLPLGKLILVLADMGKSEFLKAHEDLLKDALNVKAVEYALHAEKYVHYKVKPNFKLIGAKYRSLVPAIKKALAEANAAHLKGKFEQDGQCLLPVDGQDVTLSAEEIEIGIEAREGYAAAGGKGVVVIVDTNVTPELEEEGLAREFINRVQNARKEMDLKYEQRIELAMKGSERMQRVVKQFKDYIAGEVLARTEVHVGETPVGWRSFDFELKAEGEDGKFAIKAYPPWEEPLRRLRERVS